MISWFRRRRSSYTFYFLVLCTFYLLMVFVFHGQLQLDIVRRSGSLTGVVRHLHATQNEANQKHEFGARFQRGLHHLQGHYPVLAQEKCNDSPRTKSFTFKEGKNSALYLYSAYLDRRETIPIVRIISILLKGKKNSVTVMCRFNQDKQDINGTLYEMCENHNKRFGGYIISCRVPLYIVQPCKVSVRMEDRLDDWFNTEERAIRIVEIAPQRTRFDFGICVPPLFGDLKTESLVEFIELSRLLGAQHFIFYDFHITNNQSRELLNYYENEGVVTLIPWQLPSSIKDTQMWYHGQLLAHNDCMYRAMSIVDVVSVQDVDEFIVPHDGNFTWHKSLMPLLAESVVGLSFQSAFYEPHLHLDSRLITIGSLTRTKKFSRVRTKVMVKPSKIFEIGIHHVSKPIQESYKIASVDPGHAYLHHYRKCVSNYGMKCIDFVQDNTLLKYYRDLKPKFDYILQSVESSR